MAKIYSVSYKAYHNERVGKVKYNGKEIHPLYIQVTFDRKPMIFKSYYFDLFSKVKISQEDRAAPSIDDIIKREGELIDFIIEKNQDDFSLDRFKTEYAYYCRDIVSLLEEDFMNYLCVFFNDEGYPAFSFILSEGGRRIIANSVIDDLKLMLQPKIYSRLLENAIYYAPPYLPVYRFAVKQTANLNIYVVLAVYEWVRPDVQEHFAQFLQSDFPTYDLYTAIGAIERYLNA